jgi:actin-like ATPase involved in cell morphogenesis/Tfp pilus assembly protein PilZ
MTDDEGKLLRQSPRYDVDWRVKLRCQDWNAAQRVAAANVSRGGLFIATGKPPVLGSRVELAIDLPDGASLVLHGECVHVRTPEQALSQGRSPGFGLKIDDAHQGDLILLEEMARVSLAPVESLETEPVTLSPLVPASALATPPPASPAPPAPPSQPVGRMTPPVPGEVRQEVVPAPAPEDAEAAPASAGPTPTPPTRLPRAATAAPGAAQPLPVVTPPPRPARRPRTELRAPHGIVGIDFGTTYTRVAVHTADGVHLLADDEGYDMMPSVVAYPDEGGCVVGWPAREYLVHEPQRTVASAKRLLGRSADHHEIQGLLASLALRTEVGPGGQVVFQIGGQPLAVPQVCAAIVRHAVQIAEKRLGTRVRKAVLSMPVTFAEEQQAALRRTAMLAGVEVAALIEEPVAGALTYGFGQGANEVVAVFDFGGGTFDFTLLDVSRDVFRVLARAGDAWLGGDDFDLALAQWAADQFWRQTRVELRQRVVEWQRLLLAAEAAKRELSTAPEATIIVPDVYRRLDLRVPVDRGVLAELCQELVDRSLEVCREAFAAAELEPRDVGQVVLTGGTTHIPLVRDAVARFFEREVTAVVSPETAVAEGAALQATRLGAPAGG